MDIGYPLTPKALTPSATIVKIGGNVLDDEAMLSALLDDFTALEGPKVLVHGGGRAASALAERLGVPVRKHDGRRITDAATLDVAVMTYAGLIGKRLAAQLQARGQRALSLCGADGNLLRATLRPKTPVDFGLVGDLPDDAVNRPWLVALLRDGLTPVLSAITHDGHGQLLNTNADTVAAAVATALADTFEVTLSLLFEKDGLLRDPHDDASVLPTVDHADYEALVADGTISEGMLPKMHNAFEALRAGVHRVVIGGPQALRPDYPTRTVLSL